MLGEVMMRIPNYKFTIGLAKFLIKEGKLNNRCFTMRSTQEN